MTCRGHRRRPPGHFRTHPDADLAGRTQRPAAPSAGSARRLLTHWASRYEVLNIKALVRGKIGQLPNEEIEQSLFLLPGFLGLNHDQLLNTDNVAELLRQLQKTPYQRLATQALRRYEERPDPFLLDATLDQQFYGELIDRAHHLQARTAPRSSSLIGRIVDRHNLVWSLRYRYNYGLQASEVLYLAIDGGRVLDRRRLQEIAARRHARRRPRPAAHSLLPGYGQAPQQITLIEAVDAPGPVRLRRARDAPQPFGADQRPVLSGAAHGGIKPLYAIVHARVLRAGRRTAAGGARPAAEEAA